MGLFSSNYESAGAGIAKNAPKKEGIALFFDIFFRKFWLMIGLNILFFIFTLPLWATLPVMYYVSNEKVSSLASLYCRHFKTKYAARVHAHKLAYFIE